MLRKEVDRRVLEHARVVYTRPCGGRATADSLKHPVQCRHELRGGRPIPHALQRNQGTVVLAANFLCMESSVESVRRIVHDTSRGHAVRGTHCAFACKDTVTEPVRTSAALMVKQNKWARMFSGENSHTDGLLHTASEYR